VLSETKKAVKPSYTEIDIHKKYDDFYNELKNQISIYIQKPNFSLLDESYNFAIEKHIKQVRKSGEPYFDHLFNVAKILVSFNLDLTTIASGFLHDVIEDTDVTVEELSSLFGDELTNLVNGVTKITSLSSKSQKIKQSENFRKMILSSANDMRVILIKFADRLHNMRTLNFMPAEKRTRIATETIEVYAPLAHRFGLQKVKIEYEDLAFKYLDSESFHFLKRKIEETEDQRNTYIDDTIVPIKHDLEQANIEASIFGRPKHFYSIYNKMKKRNKPFEEIYDLLAIRIMVEKAEQCYFALGVVHSLYLPVVDRFKDYIATPKINGYQSLHTTVIGPDGRMVEIQIRTEEMHLHAEEGIAAHWRYKNDSEKNSKAVETEKLTDHISWLKQFIEQQNEDESEEFLENLKIDLFQDEVFVYSPKGDLYTLPKGASALDFAFQIHSNLGEQCSGAKINGQIKQIKTVLNNGDVVHIVSSKSQRPTREWLNFVVTGKAKHHIKKFIRLAERDSNIHLGEDYFNDILKQLRLKKANISFNVLLKAYNKTTRELFYEAIARNEISIDGLIERLSENRDVQEHKKLPKTIENEKQSSTLFGIKNLLTNYAKCCNPIPGDSIIGYITTGRGLTIHRSSCNNASRLVETNESRIIKLNWSFITADQDYLIKLNILADNRNFLLKDLTNELARIDVSLRAINVGTDGKDNAIGSITVAVTSLDQLSLVIRSLKKIPAIRLVERDQDSID
jgi:GTP pyrophosphokinase